MSAKPPTPFDSNIFTQIFYVIINWLKFFSFVSPYHINLFFWKTRLREET